MQISPALVAKPGHHVRVRGARWRVVDVRVYDDCHVVTLVGVGPPHAGVERRVLAPFDTIEPVNRRPRPRFVRPSRWRRACRALIAGDTPPGALRSLRHARIDVMPHQLEPALAILRGLGCRVLLADEVGLGKTIQTGIVIAELRARGAADRVLVLTPAGLREQWASELGGRFALNAHIADAVSMRALAATLPIGVNPWCTEQLAISSIDYVKRPEVMPVVAAQAWDILVVDEAHHVAGDSDRRTAVGALASRASYVLLLTATPHNGDRRAFASLCGLGSLDNDSLLVFHRARSHVRGAAARRVHALHVRSSSSEARMHALLARYTDAVRAEHGRAWLAASVLHKRALSSAWSLAQSVERRLDLLARTRQEANGEQLALPLGDADGELITADEPPGWPGELGLADAAHELRLLRELLSAARSAATNETKLAAVRRILRRSCEPAIVFTEYRDTLLHIHQSLGRPAAVLHGGLTRDERAAALEDFSRQHQTVLLATDAAGEGLNLHRACRLIINLELPWNPMRLEQRIGRVDRIGQQRRVHAFHLIADGTGETRILARLRTRVGRAQADIGAPNPLGTVGPDGNDEERAIARLVILGADFSAAGRPDRQPDAIDGAIPRITPDLRSESIAEADRLMLARSFTRSEDEHAAALVGYDGPWIHRARRWAARASLGHRVLLVWTAGYEDVAGRMVESACPATIVRLARLPCVRDRVWIEELLRRIDPEARSIVTASLANWRASVERMTDAFTSTRLGRERAIAGTLDAANPDVIQPGLFDRRAERSGLIAAEARRLARDVQSKRIDRVASDAILLYTAPRLLLVLTS